MILVPREGKLPLHKGVLMQYICPVLYYLNGRFRVGNKNKQDLRFYAATPQYFLSMESK